MVLGFIFSIIVSVLFAVYAVPRKFSEQNVILYTMWMGIAYFICAIVLVSIVWGFGFEQPENLLNPWHLLTVLRGFVWVLGMAAYNYAIDNLGLVRFNQWKNIQGPVGSLLILLIVVSSLGLDISGMKLLYLLLGMIVMFLSAMLFQVKTDAEKGPNIKNGTKLGIVCALFSGICFGVTALLNNIVSRPTIVGELFTYAQLLYHSASLIVFSAIIYIIVGTKSNEPSTIRQRFEDIIKVDKKTWLPFTAGAMFLIATLLTIYSYRLIDNGAIPWSIMQFNVFWTVLIGIFVFKEASFKQYWLRFTAGTIMAVSACVLLFFAIVVKSMASLSPPNSYLIPF